MLASTPSRRKITKVGIIAGPGRRGKPWYLGFPNSGRVDPPEVPGPGGRPGRRRPGGRLARRGSADLVVVLWSVWGNSSGNSLIRSIVASAYDQVPSSPRVMVAS